MSSLHVWREMVWTSFFIPPSLSFLLILTEWCLYWPIARQGLSSKHLRLEGNIPSSSSSSWTIFFQTPLIPSNLLFIHLFETIPTQIKTSTSRRVCSLSPTRWREKNSTLFAAGGCPFFIFDPDATAESLGLHHKAKKRDVLGRQQQLGGRRSHGMYCWLMISASSSEDSVHGLPEDRTVHLLYARNEARDLPAPLAVQTRVRRTSIEWGDVYFNECAL